MVAVSLVVSTIVMGILLVAIVLAIARVGSPRGEQIIANRRYLSARAPEPARGAEVLLDIARGPVGWMAAFFTLVFGVGAGALLAVGGFGVNVPGAVTLAVAGLLFLAVCVYLVLGIYYAARSRGHPDSLAVAEGVGVLALVTIAGIAVRLIMA